MFVKSLIWVFVFALVVSANIQQKLIDARAAERTKQYEQAIQLYKEVLQADFTSKEAWQGLLRTQAAKEVAELPSDKNVDRNHSAGKIYLKYFQYPTAIHFLSNAFQNQQEQIYLFDLATAYLKAGFNARCISLLEEQAKLHAKDGAYLKKIAHFLYQHRFYEEAANIFNQIKKQKLENDTLDVHLAICYENTGELKQAEEIFEKALKKYKNDYMFTEFTRFYIRTNQFEKAVKIAKKSDDDFNLVEVYLKLKGRPAVIQYFKEKLKKEPQTLAYYIWIAELYSLEKQFTEAEKILKEGLLRFPTNEQMWESLAKVYLNLKDYKNALKIYNKRLPKTQKNLKQKLAVLIQLKDLNEAQKLIDQLKSQKALTDIELAKLYEATFPKKAETIYLELLKSSPKNTMVLSQYLNFLKKQRRYDQAVELILKHAENNLAWLNQDGASILRFLSLNGYGDKATDLAHQYILSGDNWKNILSPSIYQPYLTTLRWTGANREYFIFLEILLEFDPDNHALYNEIAQLYEQNENWKEALYYYKKLLKESPHNAFLRYKVATMYGKMDEKEKGLKVLQNLALTLKPLPIDLYYLARYYYDLGYFEQALNIVNQIVGQKVTPEIGFSDPYAFELKTKILEASGKLTEAYNTLQQYVKDFPDELQPHQLLAEYLYRHGDFKGAEMEYKRLFQLDPQNLTILRRIAMSMVYQNKVDEAHQFLEEQIKQSSFIAKDDIDYYKGYIAHIMNDYKTALNNYQKALKRQPDNAHILLLQGLLFEEMNNLDEALEVYKKAMAKDSAFSRYDKLGDIYLRMHEYKKALNYYSLYRNLRPNDLSVFTSIAQCYLGLGKDEEIYTLIGMLQSFPESSMRSYQEARLYEMLENYVVAERNYLKSVLLQSGVTPALRSLAQLYIKMGNFLEAEVWARKYYEAAPQSPYNMDLLGTFYLESQDFVSAEYWFRKISSEIPWYYFAKNNLGMVYLQTGRFKEAKEIFQELTKAHPEQPIFHRNLALSEIRLNNLKNAENIYLELIKNYPYNLANYVDYTRFLIFYKNSPRKAREILNRALAIAPHNKDLTALDLLIKAFENKTKQAISGLLDLQTYYNDNNRYKQGTLALYLSLAYEKGKDLKTRNEYLAIAQKMAPNDFWITEIHQEKDIPLKVVAISEKPEVVAAQQKQGLMDTFQKYEDRFTSLELGNRFKLSEVSTEKVKEKIDKQSEFDVSITPDHLQNTSGLQLVQAPKIVITDPKDGHHTRASSITVEGFITQNKKPLTIDLNGKEIKDIGPSVKIKKKPDPQRYSGAIPFRVEDFPLVPGANFLTVHAKFKDGYETSSTIRVGRIAKLLYAFETIPKRAKGINRWALIVANEDYEDPNIQDLLKVKSDVKSFKSFLTDPNSMDIPESNILVLSLSTGIQPTRAAVIDGIKTIARYVEPQDEVFILFLGNAVLTEAKSTSSQSLSLLVQDSQIDNIYSTGINLDYLHLMLKSIPASTVNCFLEANLFTRSGSQLKVSTSLNPTVLNFEDDGNLPNVNFLFMGNGFKQNHSNTMKASRFTLNLIKALKGAADINRDKKITFAEIFKYLKARIQGTEIVLGSFQRNSTLFGLGLR